MNRCHPSRTAHPAAQTRREADPSSAERAAEQGCGTVSNPTVTGMVTLTTPNCETYVNRVVAEVLPCVEEQRPDMVAFLQE